LECITPIIPLLEAYATLYTSVDATTGGMEAWAESGMSALGLGLGGAVTVPEFGWAVMAPVSLQSMIDQGNSHGSLHDTPPVAESYDPEYDASSLEYMLSSSHDSSSLRRRAHSETVCLEGEISVSTRLAHTSSC